jgi:hypothetical protein
MDEAGRKLKHLQIGFVPGDEAQVFIDHTHRLTDGVHGGGQKLARELQLLIGFTKQMHHLADIKGRARQRGGHNHARRRRPDHAGDQAFAQARRRRIYRIGDGEAAPALKRKLGKFIFSNALADKPFRKRAQIAKWKQFDLAFVEYRKQMDEFFKLSEASIRRLWEDARRYKDSLTMVLAHASTFAEVLQDTFSPITAPSSRKGSVSELRKVVPKPTTPVAASISIRIVASTPARLSASASSMPPANCRAPVEVIWVMNRPSGRLTCSAGVAVKPQPLSGNRLKTSP